MAETASPSSVNFFQAMMNPQFAASQLQVQRQQALAQQLMEQGSEQPPTAQLANPGGLVVPNSPVAALARALEKGAGGYMQGKALADQMNSYYGLAGRQTPDQSPTGQGGAPLLPWQNNALTGQPQGAALGNALSGSSPASSGMTPTTQEQMLEAMQPGMGKAAFEERMKVQNAGKIAADTSGNTYVKDANENFVQPGKSAAHTIQSSPAPQDSPAITPQSPAGQAASGDMYDAKPETNVMPNKTDATPQPMLSDDGKPILSDIPANYIAPKRSIGDYGGAATNTGVDAQKKLFDADQKSYGFLSSNAASTRESQARLNELSDIFEKAQSGTAQALFPELAKRYAAITGTEPKDLGALQAAAGTSILSNINAIKDANSNQEGAPVRTFGPEISHTIEDYLSNKNQPDALYKLVTQMKGINAYKLAMANDYEKIGNTGNALLNGKTMPLTSFANRWQSEHSMNDFIANARKSTPPFKGMPGNNGASAPPGRIAIFTPDGKAGTIDAGDLTDLLKAGGKQQ